MSTDSVAMPAAGATNDRWLRKLAIIAALTALAGCSTVPIP
jgi:hypothetical protein